MPATFDFPYHQLVDVFPESGQNIQFGRGYSFASAPLGPDQMTFKLKFEAMFYWFDASRAPSTTAEPSMNLNRLVEFYETHRMYEPFTYVHDLRGSRTVRFLKPLPELVPMKNKIIWDSTRTYRGHQVEPFEVLLIDQNLDPAAQPMIEDNGLVWGGKFITWGS